MFPNASREEVDLSLAVPSHAPLSRSFGYGFRRVWISGTRAHTPPGRLDWLAPVAAVLKGVGTFLLSEP